jgi:RNA-binding protein
MTRILPYRKDILQSTGDPRCRCDTMRVFHATGSNGTNHMGLTSAQTKRLRAEGHRLKLKPVVIIGQKGLGDNQHHEIDGALDHHELIKLRIPALGKDDKRELCTEICTRHSAQLVQSIGNVIVIYRCNPELDRFAKIVDKATASD